MKRHRFGLLAATTSVLLLCAAPAALASSSAQDTSSKLSIRKIDASRSKNVDVTFAYSGSPADLTGLTIREDGNAVRAGAPRALSETGQRVGVVLVVDLSGSMADKGSLTHTKEGLRKIMADLNPQDEVAIVGFNDGVKVYQDLTTDRESVNRALDGLDAPRKAKTSLWDGVKKGATLLRDSAQLQPNILLVTDGHDDASEATFDGAQAAVTDAGASVFAMGLTYDGQFDNVHIPKLVDRAGGRLFRAAESGSLMSAFASVTNSLRNQWVVQYPSVATQGQVDFEMSVADAKASASYVAGSVSQGASRVKVRSPSKPFGPAFLRSKAGLFVGFGLVGVAVALGVYAAVALATRGDDDLQASLRPYSDGYAPDEDDGDDGQGMAQTAFLQKAVQLTGGFAARQGFLTKVEGALERADLPLRAAEALFFWLAASVVLGLFGLVLSGLVGGFAAFIAGLMIPPAAVKYLARRRSKAFQKQLPDTLGLLSGSLRAGYSLMQGVEAISVEVIEPMGKELRRVITEARLGRDLEDALDGIAERMGSPDFAWAVMAIRIQREVGGNLAELLLTVAETMTERDRLRRDVASLTAEGKISAIVLALLPVGLGGAMWVINPEYMNVLFTTGAGQGMLGGSMVAALIGFAWMKKTVQIEI